VNNDFDQVAPFYDRLAKLIFGERLLDAQAHHLAHLPPAGKIAIVGGGAGKILDAVSALPTQPEKIYYIDASQRMLQKAKQRLNSREHNKPAQSVQFIEASVENWQPQEQVDALITPFFLDCFDGPALKFVVSHLNKCLRPGGLWLLTDFVSSQRVGHLFTVATMFTFFRITAGLQSKRLENYGGQITRLGYTSLDQREFDTIAGPVISEVFQKQPCAATIAVAQSPSGPETETGWSRH